MQNLPCEVVRDLLPSYVDGLTGDITNDLVDAHLDACPDCRAALEVMRGGEARPLSPEDKKEVEFLKKNRRRNRRVAFASILAALALLFGVIGVRLFVTGDKLSGDSVYVRADVDGSHLSLTCACTDSLRAVSGIRFQEEDGVITATARAVLPSLLHRGDSRGEFDAAGPIREVRFNDRVLWANGKPISPVTAALFASAHDYVGDMPANLESAAALGISARLGAFSSELDTERAPYVWHIRLDGALVGGDIEGMRGDLQRLGYALLAVVGNLDEVRFEYTRTDMAGADDQQWISLRLDTVSVTTQDADAWFGRDVKACAKDICLLEELLTRADLTTLH